jgi:hypothetical protein
MGIAVSETDGSLKITCEPTTKTAAVEITCGPNGSITIKAGAGGTITIDAGGSLELKAKQGIKIDGTSSVEIKGASIKLN